MEKLKQIVKEFIEIARNDLHQLSDDCLFENAVKLYISNNIQEQKGNQDSTKQDLITDAQKYKFKQLGIEFKENMTKREAHQIISEKVGGK